MKRLFDCAFAVMLLWLLLPIFIIIALMIYCDSPGSIFFCQDRIGYRGLKFTMYKFRTMVNNAEFIGPYYTIINDNRVTRFGKFLRRSSLDELPQLINILKGDMSFVGPRPEVFEQQIFYTPSEWERRHSMRPGITGMAQAGLRSSASMEERKYLDFFYINQASFFLDMKIIIKTIKQIFCTGGI